MQEVSAVCSSPLPWLAGAQVARMTGQSWTNLVPDGSHVSRIMDRGLLAFQQHDFFNYGSMGFQGVEIRPMVERPAVHWDVYAVMKLDPWVVDVCSRNHQVSGVNLLQERFGKELVLLV